MGNSPHHRPHHLGEPPGGMGLGMGDSGGGGGDTFSDQVGRSSTGRVGYGVWMLGTVGAGVHPRLFKAVGGLGGGAAVGRASVCWRSLAWLCYKGRRPGVNAQAASWAVGSGCGVLRCAFSTGRRLTAAASRPPDRSGPWVATMGSRLWSWEMGVCRLQRQITPHKCTECRATPYADLRPAVPPLCF